MNNKKDEFLANSANKQRFLVILGEKLAESGCHISHAESDADHLIVLTTIEHAKTVATVLVGDDTYLLILLCHHTPDQGTYNIYMKPESRTTTKKAPRCWDIKLLRRTLGLNICANILFAHAILGCDTTSRLFGIGKGVILKQLKTSLYFHNQAKVFNDTQSAQQQIVAAGENALVIIYGGKVGDTLNKFRLIKFCQKVGSSTSTVQPQTLLPTSNAALYHSLHVYHQVQEWKGNKVCAVDWGWKCTIVSSYLL